MNSNVAGSKLPRSILNHWVNTTSKFQNQKIPTWIKHGHTSIVSHTANTWTSWSTRSTWVFTEAWTDFGPVTRPSWICSCRSWGRRCGRSRGHWCDLGSLPRQTELPRSDKSEQSQIHLRVQQSTPLACHTNLCLASHRCWRWCLWQRWYHRSIRPVGWTLSWCFSCHKGISCWRCRRRSLWAHWRRLVHCQCWQSSRTLCRNKMSITMSRTVWNRGHDVHGCARSHNVHSRRRRLSRFGFRRCWTSGCSIVASHLFHCSLWWRCSWLNSPNRTFDLCRLCCLGLLWHTLHWRCLDWRSLGWRLGTHHIRSGRRRCNLSWRWVLGKLSRKSRCWWMHRCRCRRSLRRNTWSAPGNLWTPTHWRWRWRWRQRFLRRPHRAHSSQVLSAHLRCWVFWTDIVKLRGLLRITPHISLKPDSRPGLPCPLVLDDALLRDTLLLFLRKPGSCLD